MENNLEWMPNLYIGCRKWSNSWEMYHCDGRYGKEKTKGDGRYVHSGSLHWTMHFSISFDKRRRK